MKILVIPAEAESSARVFNPYPERRRSCSYRCAEGIPKAGEAVQIAFDSLPSVIKFDAVVKRASARGFVLREFKRREEKNYGFWGF